MTDTRINELKTLLPRCLLPDWVRLGSRLVRLLRDAHHPDKHDVLLDRLLRQAHASIALREERRLNLPALSYPPDLPITARRLEIVQAIRSSQVLIIAGETGSGKTTQLPKMCLEAGLGIEAQIGCTQPRRVAALSISRRIADELRVTWGREVGCTIRFDDRSSPHTYVKLMTDGILLAETQGDPNLSHYNALIIDEAHERSLNIDFLLGHLKGLLARRPDLKLIVTSATLDTGAFSRHFNEAPVIEVSGRLYPVDVAYRPIDPDSENRGDSTYVDAAVATAEQLLLESDSGDLLIFMPTERDIRETGDQLQSRVAGVAEVIPLFGRLSAGEQQRVFAPSTLRKIVVATNIAETSLTIPGIRYVIDTGLARISHYNPRTRTRRLPVEPVSQGSANQRKGRAGRVRDGLCIRLYSEEDFAARPLFTQPEIQRANLAEVILRLKAFGLGDIETFPFLQPPTPAAIAAGYALLQELGALDPQRALTPLGKELARLPIDPTLGRMLLQSRHEHATREILIIASGLSIQDPRERPLDQKAAATAAHRRFDDPKSDFLALLNIWNAVHDQWESLRTQGQRRRFCRQHFLSYLRMREWQDLQAQLSSALEDLGNLRLNESNARYDAIHRSILAGLVGHVARREDRNLYQASGNRKVTVFPGSALHARAEPARPHDRRRKEAPSSSVAADDSPAVAQGRRRAKAGSPRTTPPSPGSTPSPQPAWIIAGEIVETSQLFARTIAGIDPHWIVQLAPHCCKTTHQNPHWSPTAGCVLVEEIVTLHGLEVHRRKVAYGNLNPDDATAIFIRAALVEEQLLPDSSNNRRGEEADPGTRPVPYPFLAHNRALRQKIENWQTRVRRYDLPDPDQALFDFYSRHLRNVSSIHELNRLLGDHPEPDFLRATESDLAGEHVLRYEAEAFPDALAIGGQPVPLSYAYAPGEDHDGVTVRVPFPLVNSVSASWLEWAVPGLREEKIASLLRALPKAIRRDLMPFPPKVAEIVRDFQPSGPSFLEDLARFIHQHFGVVVTADSWPDDALPAHLRPRLEIIDQNQQSLAAGRDLHQLRDRLTHAKPATAAADPPAWQQAARKWERFGLSGWTFGDLPERISISEGPGLPLYAWPGLEVEGGTVNLRLFRSADAVRAPTLAGIQHLVELAIQKDLGWLEKDLRGLRRFDPLYAPIGSSDELQGTALDHLRRHLLPAAPLPALTAAHFQATVDEARRRLPGLAQQLIDRVGTILELHQQISRRLGANSPPHPAGPRKLSALSQLGAPSPSARSAHPLLDELATLLPPRFLDHTSFERLPHLSRYLKALLIRIDRAALNPIKDRERAQQLAPYMEALRKLRTHPPRALETLAQVEELRWLIEEFKVSLFAQELGTPAPVSPKRLDQYLDRLRHAVGR